MGFKIFDIVVLVIHSKTARKK